MTLSLAGSHAFVSASTQGIGYACAAALARRGAAVTINGRTQASVDAAVRRLKAELPEASIAGIAADMASAADIEETVSTLGRVDILVNNAGVFEVKEFADITDAEWSRYVDLNLMSGVRLSRALLPPMLARGHGRIIFIASESGVNVPADMIHYGATKAAMLALANGLAKLTRGTAVTVNSVLGGPTYSDGVAAAVEQIAAAQGISAEAMRDAIIGGHSTTLVERFLKPEEVAALVGYLAGPESSATNGAALRADGGALTGVL